MAKQILIGKVVSDKMQNTVVVEIERLVKHPVYKKTLKRTNKIKADTTEVKAKIGSFVAIEQSKPISRDKRFKVIRIIKEALKSV